MSWFTRALNYSVGKKILMALTGLFLIVFLVVHLTGNLMLYGGKEAFETWVETLEGPLAPFIKIMEIVLVLGFGLHIYDGLRVTLHNWGARPEGYHYKRTDPGSTFASRTMWISASIVFIFLVVHLRNLWYEFKFGAVAMKQVGTYDITVSVLSDPIYGSLYFIASIILGFHLYHGFQSAFQTLGLNHKKYTPAIKFIGRLYAIVVAGGFASLPLYFLLRGGK
jgi:succinate dehydrogenase / fumarate reductase cytochrome b subunit